jgi:hypothetical protein
MDTRYYSRRVDGFMVDAGCPLNGGDPSIRGPKYGTRDGRDGSRHGTPKSHTHHNIQGQHGATVCDIDRGHCMHCSARGIRNRYSTNVSTVERLDRGSAIYVGNRFTGFVLDNWNNDHTLIFQLLGTFGVCCGCVEQNATSYNKIVFSFMNLSHCHRFGKHL